MSFGVTGLFGLVPFVCSASVVSTFKDVNRELSTRWAQHDVIGQKPTFEWVGHDAVRVSFRMRFDLSLGTPPVAYSSFTQENARTTQTIPSAVWV